MAAIWYAPRPISNSKGLHMEHLSRLLYVSTAKSVVTEDDLQQILESSRKYNREHNITGVLCGSGRHFIQVLEGAESNLIRLYAKILDDPRHHCMLIGLAPIAGKMFAEWSMGYIQHSQEDIHIEWQELLKYRLHHDDDGELVRIMKRFLNRLKPA